ncbi:hypothetical protein CXB51_008886 [Gossypium anomalum]|uniref:UBC core domain-containing protein n=1 Tax=Gossypium anomalum TaxID=47600 RepID=A0A8J5ZFQ0_9ROSI|nr:hypothetical protein CXB51_008886 [Gossypium anomalum]
MIRLFKVKETQKVLAQNPNGEVPTKKQSAGELRLHNDITELNLPNCCTISFPNGKDDLMNFEVSPVYPHDAPKVKCIPKVYHPNIDYEGNVCLNTLRED